MKPIFAFVCAALLVLIQTTRAWADDLDDLLTSPPAVGQVEATTDEATHHGSNEFDYSDSEGLGYNDPSHWQSPLIAPVSKSSKHDTRPAPAADKSAQPGDFSVVPEPSAIVLGVLALLYFMVFGRRRNVA